MDVTSVNFYVLMITLLLFHLKITCAFPSDTLESSTTKPVPFLRNYIVESTDDIHKFSYQLSDGQSRQETVEIINSGTVEEEIKIYGSYSFNDDTDNLHYYLVEYNSDRNGYHATVKRLLIPNKRIQPNLLKSLVG